MIAFAGMDARLRAHAEATVAAAEREGIKPNIISVRRNAAEQAKLRANYEAGISRWPAERVGTSSHQYGVGWDATVKPEHQERWNQIRAAFGWKLYGNDLPHAEYPGWYSVRQYLLYS